MDGECNHDNKGLLISENAYQCLCEGVRGEGVSSGYIVIQRMNIVYIRTRS